MKITPVKGTHDYTPQATELRDYLLDTILDVYKENGFQHITTPMLEDISNLDKSDGGENLNLIFKVLKRGEKLKRALEQGNENALCDIGLRYDLTLPLSRFYANNKANILLPFKCIQVDKVFRAERPQRGRLREFMQCDIDILGSTSKNCEIELIVTTAKALLALGMSNFNVKINDKRLLRSVLTSIGFKEEELSQVSIVLDKLDKIGLKGVEEELLKYGYDVDSIEELVKTFKKLPVSLDGLNELGCSEVINNLKSIIDAVRHMSKGQYNIQFDLSLVRGQGYYTGTVFEIESSEFKGSIAGGGRYDHLIGKFVKEEVPAVGFSIGFERIFSILMDSDFNIPNAKKRVAILYSSEDINKGFEIKEQLSKDYTVSLFEKPKKVGKYLNKLKDNGYYGFIICGESAEVKPL